MIKRISHILIALIVFVVTTGMTISTHYCGTSVKDMSFLSEIAPCCDDTTGCCHSETITLKIEDSFSISSYSFDFSEVEIELPAIIELIDIEAPAVAEMYFLIHLKPPLNIQTLLSSLQNYRL